MTSNALQRSALDIDMREHTISTIRTYVNRVRLKPSLLTQLRNIYKYRESIRSSDIKNS